MFTIGLQSLPRIIKVYPHAETSGLVRTFLKGSNSLLMSHLFKLRRDDRELEAKVLIINCHDYFTFWYNKKFSMTCFIEHLAISLAGAHCSHKQSLIYSPPPKAQSEKPA